ncbi:IS3 family transposase [Kribbella sp. VKM Ac-2566]|uniref:IS3 family transposase n=1 Tax=Kribbella sp. VKM Ac-2566 TaxID=2512218 RepID=UPI001064025D|nr:IS3 family transposase [Kribbella sp. VKM Ac-2566]
MNCYPFIEAEKQGDHNVKRACELLQVSRSAYYADRASGPSLREQRDVELTARIIEIHDESTQTYGSPRVHRELLDQGHRCSRKRVVRLMQAADRHGRIPRRWNKTTIADPDAAQRPDLIGATSPLTPTTPVSWTAAGAATSPTSTPGKAGSTWPP